MNNFWSRTDDVRTIAISNQQTANRKRQTGKLNLACRFSKKQSVKTDDLHSQQPRLAKYLSEVKNVDEILEFKERLNYKVVMTAKDALENRKSSATNKPSYHSKLKFQFLGWHGTSKAGAKELIERGARSDYEPSERQLRDNLYGEGIYIAGDKRLAGEYADPVSRFTRQPAKGEIIEAWAVMETGKNPDPFRLEASKNREFLIARAGMYPDLFFKKAGGNSTDQQVAVAYQK